MLEAVLFDWGDTLMQFAYSPELVSAGHRAGLAAIGRDGLPDDHALTEHFREHYEPFFWVREPWKRSSIRGSSGDCSPTSR